MRRGSACGLVLFGLVLVITGLGETGIFCQYGSICEEDGGGGENGINSDPSPLENCTYKVSPRWKAAPASLFCTEMIRLTVWCVHTSV